jgi:dipeptidyl aminopeptidase/acylaminoacyl peptidase
MAVTLAIAAACGTAAPLPARRSHSTIDVAQIRDLLDAYENWGGVLSPDGTKLLFRSDRGGVAELYVADVASPGAPATKIIAGPERVASAVFTRDGGSVIFRKDTGANEIFHIYRAATDGSNVVDVTPPEPLWRDSPLLPRARPELMVYGARDPADYKSMIVVQPIAGGPARVAFRDPGAGTVIDVSADASHALWFHEVASGGHELQEVELATGAARTISPRAGAALLTYGAYSADGKLIYVATDNGTETHVVQALDRETLAERASYTQIDPVSAEIAAIVPSPRGDRIAIMIDAGNHTTVRLLDAATLAVVAEIATPLGTTGLAVNSETRVRLGGGTFADDGAHFTIEVSAPDAPGDVYLVDTATGAAAPVRKEPRPVLDRLPPITASIVEVTSFDGVKVPVNVYLPARRAPGQRLGTYVWFHGGPDANSPLEWDAWYRVLIANGYAVLEPNIRGSTGFGRAFARGDDREKRWDALRDVAAVNTWARRQPWCDPARMVIAGGSFGGYVTLMALENQPTLWRAGVDLAGPSDLISLIDGHTPMRYIQEVGDPVKDRALLASLSPIHAVDKIRAPLFVYQGANDQHVRRDQADSIVAALRERGVPVEYMVPTDEGHTVARRANEVELYTRVLRFLEDQLAPRS